MPSEDQEQDVRSEYRLNEDNELRLEIGDEEVIVELVEGSAEVFGTPLVLHKRYTFPPGFRSSVFTYCGALVEIIGKTESAYIAFQTPMVMYLNTHYALERHRQAASIALNNELNPEVLYKIHGPRILVAGNTDVGKSTLCRILLNYATRFDRTPIYVDIDVGQGQTCIPGSVGAILVSKPADIVEGFDRSSVLAYNFGSLSPSDNPKYYTHLIKTLAKQIDEKCVRNGRINASGIVINTCGWVKDAGYRVLLETCRAFRVDVVVVLDNELLFNMFKKDLPSNATVVHEPKSGGVESRSRDVRAIARRRAIQNYFYGLRSCPFHPFNIEVNYGKADDEVDLVIAKVGTDRLPESCLPVGMAVEDHRTKVVRVPITMDLKNHLLALMPPNATVDQCLITMNVLGYVVITDIDTTKKTISLLSPQPQPLPSKIALLSDITYFDES